MYATHRRQVSSEYGIPHALAEHVTLDVAPTEELDLNSGARRRYRLGYEFWENMNLLKKAR